MLFVDGATQDRNKLSYLYLGEYFDHTTSAIIILDAKGIVKTVNGVYKKMFGWHMDQIVGKKICLAPHVPEPYRFEANKNFREIRVSRKMTDYLVVRKRKNGDSILVSASASLIEWRGGTFKGVIGKYTFLSFEKFADEDIGCSTYKEAHYLN